MTKPPHVSSLSFVVLIAWAVAAGEASADVLASTDFTGRIVTGRTASNIPWVVSGVQAPGNLSWVNEGGGPTDTPLFDTTDAEGHFAPDLNIDNEGPWSVTIPVVPTLPEVQLEKVVLTWRHFSNSGLFQTASRSANWTVSVTGSVSGPLGSVTAFNVGGLAGVTTLTFTAPLALTASESYALKIHVVGTTGGNNTGLDALSLEGPSGPVDPPATPPLRLSIDPVPGGFHLSWPSRPGMNYRLRGSADLSGPPAAWPEETGELIATPPVNTEPVFPAGDTRFYVLEERPAPPLNILLVIADDWRHDTLGCAGHPIIQPPHLDRLAQEGLRFTQASVTTAVCWVAASAFSPASGCRATAKPPPGLPWRTGADASRPCSATAVTGSGMSASGTTDRSHRRTTTSGESTTANIGTPWAASRFTSPSATKTTLLSSSATGPPTGPSC